MFLGEDYKHYTGHTGYSLKVAGLFNDISHGYSRLN